MSTPYTQRVDVGAYYTDGIQVWEVVRVYDLGAVDLRNASTYAGRSMGIDAFHRTMWLVKTRSTKG